MTLRIRFLITALFLCHQLPASSLVTSQLLAEISGQSGDVSAPIAQQKNQSATTPCASQAANEESDQTTICATSQEKDGEVYKLHGNAEIHYRDYVLRADEVTYNSDSGEATAVEACRAGMAAPLGRQIRHRSAARTHHRRRCGAGHPHPGDSFPQRAERRLNIGFTDSVLVGDIR